MKTVNKKTSIGEGIEEIVDQANNDYQGRHNSNDMSKRFSESWEIKYGKKYIKLINRESVWGFICLEDDSKFNLKKGDLLF